MVIENQNHLIKILYICNNENKNMSIPEIYCDKCGELMTYKETMKYGSWCEKCTKESEDKRKQT